MIQKRQRIIQISFVVITLLFVYWIFSNSMKDAAASTLQSDSVKAMLQTAISTLFPNSSIQLTSHFVRKLAHFSEYALLGFLLFLSCRECKAKLRCLLVPTGVSTVAFLDEGLQNFFDGRGPSLKDVALDSLGGYFGFIVAWVLYALVLKKLLDHLVSQRERSPKLSVRPRRLGWSFPSFGKVGALGMA
jgi:VanZ family protein